MASRAKTKLIPIAAYVISFVRYLSAPCLPPCYNSFVAKSISEIVGAFLCHHGLVKARLVVAVSGGPDSVCLLCVLAGLRDELSLELRVAHLDHGLRKDSATDAIYVAQLAGKLGLVATIERADVQGYRREKGLGLEEAAREVRYRFFAKLADELDTPYIVTGHTMSDRVETILLHLIRGTGLNGLIGLKPLTPWTLEGHKLTIVRPLLEARHSETEDYCRNAGFSPRQDATNLSLEPLRNRLRLELIPRLREYNPGIEEALLRLAVTTEMDLEYLETEMAKVWDGVVSKVEGAVVLGKAALLGLSAALQRHLLRGALRSLLGDLKDIEMRHIEYIMSSFNLAAGCHIDLPHGVVFAVDYHCYWLGRAKDLPSPYPVLSGENPLEIPGITNLVGWRVEARYVREHVMQMESGLVAYFDLETLGQGLTVRAWRHGDRFRPLGMAQEKKLGRFMIDEKIPQKWRAHIPLVVTPHQIAWLVGYRIDDRVKVATQTERVLRLEFKRR